MNRLFNILLVLAFGNCVEASTRNYYVDPLLGNDSASGSAEHPFGTIARALQEVDGPGGIIWLKPEAVFQEPITIRRGGAEANPLVIEGQGSTINLGRNVTAGPWVQIGGEYMLDVDVPAFKRTYVTSPLFINGLPIWAEHPQGRGKPAWHGGSLRFGENGRMIVKFPHGLTPENATVVLTADDFKPAVHASGGQHVIIRDLTTAFAGNDGFNLHNDCKDYRLERVRAVFNGDQGISSHGRCVVDILESEVGFNGTASGGIVDIDDSVTSYTNVLIHNNRNNGVELKGRSHRLEGVVSFGNQGQNLPRQGDGLTMIDCVSEHIRLPANFPDWGSAIELGDRKTRFDMLLPNRE